MKRLLGWILTPWTLLVLAALPVLSLGICHALGWRAYICILSGSLPLAVNANTAVFGGVLYALSYFASVVVAPILVLTAVLLFALRRVWRRAPSVCSDATSALNA